MVEWNGIFRLFRFSGILGQPHEVNPKFRNEIPENVCSIRSPTRHFRNCWSNQWKAPFFSLFHQADFVSWKGILWAFLGEGPQEKSSLNSSPLVYCLLVKLEAVKRPIWIQTDVYRVRSIAAFKLLSTGKHWLLEIFKFLLCTSQFQNRPSPPGQSPGIWLTLSSVQRGIWPKMRPARWGIWLSCLNVCQRSEAKGFCNSLIQHVSRVHGSLLLSIPRGFFCCCRFI